MKSTRVLTGAFGLLGLILAACSASSDPQAPPAAGLLGEGGANSTGATPGTGNTGNGATGATGNGATGSGGEPIVITPGSYDLPPPNQCVNRYYVDGCVEGDASSVCGGTCTPRSAGHAEDSKSGEWGYACPRYMMYADEMIQAAIDDAGTYGWASDGSSPFRYAVAGHDFNPVVDTEGKSVCCQCYQLVFDTPAEPQVIDQQTGQPTVPLPKPLVAQVFNTGATTESFDLYMGAGGLGAFNACYDPTAGGPALYSSYPTIGQPNDGGVKAAGNPGNGTACKNELNLVSAATLASPGCVQWIEEGCNQIEHAQEHITRATRRSCIETNRPESLYHLNWNVYVKRVACPAGLTQVTGCKIVEEQPPVDPSVTTPEAAAAAGFVTGLHTTTMQDCAKPTCAAQDWVTGEGHTADGNYNSFYTCNQSGMPFTE